MPNSHSMNLNQITSAMPKANSLYSNSMEDLDTTFYLLELQKIKLSSTLEAQSVFEKEKNDQFFYFFATTNHVLVFLFDISTLSLQLVSASH